MIRGSHVQGPLGYVWIKFRASLGDLVSPFQNKSAKELHYSSSTGCSSNPQETVGSVPDTREREKIPKTMSMIFRASLFKILKTYAPPVTITKEK